ncbi:hypothetical protein [Nocardia suismassiliense]|uniref:hypothetical protein n=1 Tax=Nocardia suismassiliense TaxID=2077092 RepID=UPI000D1F09F4|nr:hypothetical protein [Nocardia suismassiliense]
MRDNSKSFRWRIPAGITLAGVMAIGTIGIVTDLDPIPPIDLVPAVAPTSDGSNVAEAPH